MRKNKYTESSKWQMRGSKRAMLLSVVGTCLSVTLLSSSALAEGCVSSPDCKSMGYTEASCSDGGVKCPWGNYWFCGAKKADTGLIGDFYYCEGQIVGIRVPGQNFAIAKYDAFDTKNWHSANNYCTGYRFCETGTMGRLPTKDELLAIHDNITYLQEQLKKNGGQKEFQSSYYWSSSYRFYTSDGFSNYWIVEPVSGDSHIGSTNTFDKYHYVRCVLDF